MLVLHLTFRGGEGDVKPVAVLGAVLGWWHGLEAAVIGYMLAAAVAVIVVVARAACRATGGENRPLLAGTFPLAPFEYPLSATVVMPADGAKTPTGEVSSSYQSSTPKK